MYAYIDESGNSGSNLRDPHQPYFYHMALLSSYNLDLDKKFQELLREFNIHEIHASQQKNLIELYAEKLVFILGQYDIRFFLHCTEKKTFAYIKLFEAIFDSGENKYADPYIYNMDSLKLALLCYFIDSTDKLIAFDFYENCLMTSNLDSSINRFKCICSNISENIKQGKNKLINRYINNVLSGAKVFPQDLSLFSEKKNYDSPNLFDWLPIMREISIYSTT